MLHEEGCSAGSNFRRDNVKQKALGVSSKTTIIYMSLDFVVAKVFFLPFENQGESEEISFREYKNRLKSRCVFSKRFLYKLEEQSNFERILYLFTKITKLIQRFPARFLLYSENI